VRVETVMRRDPVLAAVRFGPGTLLSPGEQDVLRRFCAGLRKLPRLPERVAVFGSRARGESDEHSDLDVAVMMDGPRDGALERALSAIAHDARKNYWMDGYGIALRPVPLYRNERTALWHAIRDEMEVVWTRP
jgi:predicted nucleotidyltransferase